MPPLLPAPLLLSVTAAVLILCALSDGHAADIPWVGQGRFRLLVTVDPVKLAGRERDERPARVRVDFGELLRQHAVDGPAAPSTIQVIRHDMATGAPVEYGKYAFAKSPYDLPFRFDEVDPRPYWFLYNLQGDGQRGMLNWIHTQQGDQPSRYGIYFDTVAAGAAPGPAPRGWIGDGDALYTERGLLPSFLHARAVPFDWSGTGKLDLVIGDLRGFVFLYRNVGTREQPDFQGPELVMADGQPLKVPWSAAPLLVDWNSDGLTDLIVGQEPQGILHYYQNVGQPGAPVFAHRGTLQADGQEIVMPFEPCPEAPGVFKQDYVGVPEVCDWNGDGKPDLLVGGYVTGRIFYYENVGTNADGTPVLAARGPLEADGQILDVIWAATPTVADVDNDGLLELVSGTMFVGSGGGETGAPGRPGLFMYKNAGTRTEPKLHEVPFPLEGKWEENHFLNPRFVDWDGNGLLDLIVGVGDYVVLYRNIGTKTEPRFKRDPALTVAWVPARAHPDWMGDWDGTGGLDMLNAAGGIAAVLQRCARRLNPPKFDGGRRITTASGKDLAQPPKHGDPWAAAIAVDFDGDGDLDVLVGDVAGYVWFYENTGTRAEPHLADAKRLELADGKPLVAGMDPDAPVTDFTVLQGNRAVPAAADFRGDGKMDLVVGDATGGLTYFENVGEKGKPAFAAGVSLGRFPGRVHVAAGDVDGDGRPEIVIADSGGGEGEQVVICDTSVEEGKVRFHLPGRKLPLCWIPYPQPSLVDINGDGDLDIVLASSYASLYWVEHSFIRDGYAEGRVEATERKPQP